jgi:predicted Zn-dependent protease
VNRVGRWVALQSERPELPWHFGVIESASINAFAAPGGYILVTRGLYELLDNEAQLAGVLGHEIAHVVARHHISVMQKSAFVSAGARAAQRDNRAAFVNSLIGNGAEIFARGLDKEAEFEADRHGVTLAARAGYNPYALVDVLQKMQARGSNDPTLALLFETHPAPADRLSKLGSALTPRVAALPSGRQPRIRTISASAPAQKPSTAERAPKGASALQPSPAAAPAGSGSDPAQFLKGLLGR